jgi:hypothetical protein
MAAPALTPSVRPAPLAPTAPRRPGAPHAIGDRRPWAKVAVVGGHLMVVGRRGVVRRPRESS